MAGLRARPQALRARPSRASASSSQPEWLVSGVLARAPGWTCERCRRSAIDARAWFNFTLDEQQPASLTVLLSMMTVACVILPAAAAVREKERGTIEQLLVSPLSPLQILFAKCASMVLVTVIGTALSVFAVMHPFFGTPLRGSARAYAMLDDEIREELVVEPDEPVISHALDVTDGGEATAAWLTPSGVWAARYAPRRGWSTPERLHALDLELESSWDTWQLSSPPPHWDDYPMQLRRSSDGRELIVWSQYEALVTKMGSDYWYREATASSVWSLIVAGSSTHLQRLSAADD